MLVPLSPILLIKQRPFLYKPLPLCLSRQYHGKYEYRTLWTQKSADSSLIIDGNIDTHNISPYRIPSFGYRVMPQHMQYPRGASALLCPRSSLWQRLCSDFAKLESEANKKNNSAYKTITRWLLLINLTGKPGISDLSSESGKLRIHNCT